MFVFFMKKISSFLLFSLAIPSLFGSAEHLDNSRQMYGGTSGTTLFETLKPQVVKALAGKVRQVGTTVPDNAWVKDFVESTFSGRYHIAVASKSDDADEFRRLRALRHEEYLVTPLHETRYAPLKKEILAQLFARLDSQGTWVETDNLRTRLRVLAPQDWPLEVNRDTPLDCTNFNEKFDVEYFQELISRGAFGSAIDDEVPSYALALIVQARRAQPSVSIPIPAVLKTKESDYIKGETLSPGCRLLRFEVEHRVSLRGEDTWMPGHGFMSILPEGAEPNEETLRKLPVLLIHTHAYFLPCLEPRYVEALKIAASTDPSDQESLIHTIGRFARLWCLNTPMKRGSAACADFMMEALFAGKGFDVRFAEASKMNLDNLCYAALSLEDFDARFKAALTLTSLGASSHF